MKKIKVLVFFLNITFVISCSYTISQDLLSTQISVIEDVSMFKSTRGKVSALFFVKGKQGGFFFFQPKCDNPVDDGIRFAGKNGCWVRQISNAGETNIAWYGAFLDGKTDDTPAVQKAINSLDPEVGGKIIIPPQAKFYLGKLSLSQRVVLDYSSSSDLSKDAGTSKSISEQYHFIANANINGAVNEYVVAAPFHPGIIIDVRKDFEGHKRHLGRSQTSDNPVRASYLIRDEGMNQLIQQYQSYPDAKNKYSGWRMNLILNTNTLSGVSMSNFLTPPKIGDIIENESRTAKGNLIRFDKSSITIQWLGGRFITGERLLFNGQLSKSEVTNVKYDAQSFNGVTLNRKNGYMGIGLPHANAIYPLSIGGRIGIQASRLHGQFIPENYTRPGIVFSPSFEDSELKGVQVLLENKNEETGRLIKTDLTERPLGNIGAASMHTAFSQSSLPATSSYNVQKIERISVGDYLIYFQHPTLRKDYQVGLSTSKPMEYAYVYGKEVDRIRIRIVRTGTEDMVDPLGTISVICLGGDR